MIVRFAPWPFLWLAIASQLGGAASTAGWKDPAPHTVRFVTVETGVQLEVLDFGGTGTPVVLLAGSGNSGHVYDRLAPQLGACCHPYAITRRGFGASSHPAAGYDDQRLADDLLKVLESLAIKSPVLVGHSMAGGELTTVGRQHSDRLAALVYLDALGDPRDWPASDPAYQALTRKLPPAVPKAPCRGDRSSFVAFQATLRCTMGIELPESELRNTFETNPDGSVGAFKTPPSVNDAIGNGQIKRDYSRISVPVLAMFEFPRSSLTELRAEDPQPRTDQERADVLAFFQATKAYVDRWVANVKRSVPNVELVNLPGAGHYIFLTREAEVLRAVRDRARPR